MRLAVRWLSVHQFAGVTVDHDQVFAGVVVTSTRRPSGVNFKRLAPRTSAARTLHFSVARLMIEMVPSSLPTRLRVRQGNSEALGALPTGIRVCFQPGGVGCRWGWCSGTVTGFTSVRSKTLMVAEPALEATTFLAVS